MRNYEFDYEALNGKTYCISAEVFDDGEVEIISVEEVTENELIPADYSAMQEEIKEAVVNETYRTNEYVLKIGEVCGF